MRFSNALGVIVLAMICVPVREVHASSACERGEGWALEASSTVPVHPTLVYYFDAREKVAAHPAPLDATIDGVDVETKVTFTNAAPYELAVIEIKSDRVGTLRLAWGDSPKGSWWQAQQPTIAYTIDRKLKLATVAHATSSRFHRAYFHSTVHEMEDGLAVRVDVPAISFAARWRRDDKLCGKRSS